MAGGSKATSPPELVSGQELLSLLRGDTGSHVSYSGPNKTPAGPTQYAGRAVRGSTATPSATTNPNGRRWSAHLGTGTGATSTPFGANSSAPDTDTNSLHGSTSTSSFHGDDHMFSLSSPPTHTEYSFGTSETGSPRESFIRPPSPRGQNLDEKRAGSWEEFALAYSRGEFDPAKIPLKPLNIRHDPQQHGPGFRGAFREDGSVTQSARASPVRGYKPLFDSPMREDGNPLEEFHTTGKEEQWPTNEHRWRFPVIPGPPFLHPNITSPDNMRAFYDTYGFLAAPRPPDDAERLRALYSFNILHTSPDDLNFDRIVHMIRVVFNVKMAFLTLLDKEGHWHKACSGYNGSATSQSPGFVSHVVVLKTDEPLVVLDAKEDWRFANNPYVAGALSVRFYAGAPLRSPEGYNLGSLSIVDDKPRTEFTARSSHILKEFAAIVMRELELWRDRLQLRSRDRIQTAMEEFTRECLETTNDDLNHQGGEELLTRVYQRSAEVIQQTLDLGGCTILDITQFQRVEVHNPDDGTVRIVYHANPYQSDEELGPVKPFPVLASTSPVQHRTLRPQEHKQVSEFLTEHPEGQIFSVTPRWIRTVFPTSVNFSMVVPILGIDNQPFVFITGHTRDQTQTLDSYELQFLRSVGAVILSAVLRRRVVLADRAKNVLISSVSHELRTPLHGMLASAELLSDTTLDSNQEAFLSTLRTCALQLIETVNHVLDFAKLSLEGKAATTQTIQSRRTDLADLIHDTVAGCWLGQRARSMQSPDGGSGSYYAGDAAELVPFSERLGLQEHLTNVETVIDIGFRAKGWSVVCESGGLRRSLMNLYNNSVKYTKQGYVQIALRELPHAPGDRRIPVELSVIDTGKGIGRDFLKHQLFEPFAQENPTQAGTGLGLAIVANIVTSTAFGGRVEVYSAEDIGTEIKLVFEVEVAEDEEVEPIPEISMTLGRGYTVGLINYTAGHSGLLLQAEVITRQATALGFTVTNDLRRADILIVNEVGALSDEVKELTLGKPLLLAVSFKIQECNNVDLTARGQTYTGILYKPHGARELRHELISVVRWLKDPGNPELSGYAPPVKNPASEATFDLVSEPGNLVASDPLSPPSPSVTQVETPPCPSAMLPTTPVQLYQRPELPRAHSMRSDASRGSSTAARLANPPSTPISGSISNSSSPVSGFSTISTEGGILLASCQAPAGPPLREVRPPRILIVEDNPINRRVLTSLLKKRGFEYSEAVDGKAGVEAFSAKPQSYWDVILMDISMPVMDGLEATRAIRAVEAQRRKAAPPPSLPVQLPSPESPRSPHSPESPGSPQPPDPSPASSKDREGATKILALTGFATTEDKRNAFSSGVDGYLVKPVSLRALDLVLKKIGL